MSNIELSLLVYYTPSAVGCYLAAIYILSSAHYQPWFNSIADDLDDNFFHEAKIRWLYANVLPFVPFKNTLAFLAALRRIVKKKFTLK